MSTGVVANRSTFSHNPGLVPQGFPVKRFAMYAQLAALLLIAPLLRTGKGNPPVITSFEVSGDIAPSCPIPGFWG